MSTRHVYVIWTQPLFFELVRVLLKHPDIQMVGDNSDMDSAQSEIVSLRPDTILIENVEGMVSNGVLKILVSCSWKHHVVLASLVDNRLNTFRHQQRHIKHADELLDLVLEEWE